MRLLKTSARLARDQGVGKLLAVATRKVFARLLPASIDQEVVYNGVRVPLKRRPFFPERDRPHNEGGVLGAHRAFTRPGDTVAMVGGGSGVSAVAAARLVGPAGRVVIYEGGSRAIEATGRTLRLNGVEEICELRHAFVASDDSVFRGSAEGASFVAPEELVECDVLELDCEGAEVEILRRIRIRPRVVIVEIHPWLFRDEPESVVRELEERGYRIRYQSGHNGAPLPPERLGEYLRRSAHRLRGDEKFLEPAPGSKLRRFDDSLKWCPVVIAAVRTGGPGEG